MKKEEILKGLELSGGIVITGNSRRVANFLEALNEATEVLKRIDTDAIEAAKAGYGTKNNPRREAYLKALEDYHDSVQDSYIRLASGLGRHGLYISYIIEENNEIFKMLKVGASEIE